MSLPLHVARIDTMVLRAPIETPVRTSFGTLYDRPAVVVRVEDDDGGVGWGEAWCNFPTCGAEHRARLIDTVLAPMIVENSWESPRHAYDRMIEGSRVLVLQTGEPGPLAQAIAGVDMALWDLAARRAGVPMWKFLGGQDDGTVPTYASGLNPDRPEVLARQQEARGYRAFKLKVGFGADVDVANLETLRTTFGPDVPLMIDANQAWDVETALDMATLLAPFAPDWLEEPLPVDAPAEDWARLAAASPVPLAGGENLRGDTAFDAAIGAGSLSVIQPDMAKWGGFSGCLPLARRIMAGGRRYYPHYLGGGLGLIASAHLLAAAGGDGLLEVDSNPNPLREGLAAPFPTHADGRMVLPEGPGLGVEPDPKVLADFRVE
jgi:D-galactarolactone cycloisomerase